MDFTNFAQAHGLIIKSIATGKWVSVPTVDHPSKRNGRYKFLGDIGWVQNWATMTAPDMWKGESVSPSHNSIRVQANRDRLSDLKRAASKAGWIMHQTVMAQHGYLQRKGFEDEIGNVWQTDKSLLVIPMRREGALVGCQLIDNDGVKKFLHGQQTKGASFVMDAKGVPIFCEGYATGLSIRAAMKAMQMRYAIHVCFSAGNLKEVCRNIPSGFIVADSDPHRVGEIAAMDANKPYWISETIGEDFNDFHQRVGVFKAAQTLKKFLLSNSAKINART